MRNLKGAGFDGQAEAVSSAFAFAERIRRDHFVMRCVIGGLLSQLSVHFKSCDKKNK